MSYIAITGADGTVTNFDFSPVRSIQHGGGAVAGDLGETTRQSVAAAGGTTAVAAGVRVVVVDMGAGAANETLTLPDPRQGVGQNLPNGHTVSVVTTNGNGGALIPITGDSGGVILSGAFSVADAGATPLQGGSTFMVFDHTDRDGWIRAQF